MANEHNPIAVKIDRLREEWIRVVNKNPNYKLARWLVHIQDMDLVTGLLKVESSQFGKLPNYFIVLLTNFENYEEHSINLVREWVLAFKQSQKEHPSLDWDFSEIEKELSEYTKEENGDFFLLRLLKSFRNYVSNQDFPITLSLIPDKIADFQAYSIWIKNIIELGLPDGVKMLVYDHLDKEFLSPICKELDDKCITVKPGDMDIQGAIQAIVTHGNPNDPQVSQRAIMFEMGKAVEKKNKGRLIKLGEQLLKVSQKTGDKILFSSAHLCYAAFLLHFTDFERVQQLLDQGIRVAKSGLKNNDSLKGMIIQFYSYKGVCYSINQKHKESLIWFDKQAQTSIEYDQKTTAISAYKNLLYFSHRHRFMDIYFDALEKAYLLSESMTDADLGVTEFTFIGRHYLEGENSENKEKCRKLDQRMKTIFGEN